MSYCRWSSDDWQCDVYCYEDCRGGWTTHVAELRHTFAETLPEKIEFGEDGYWERDRKVMQMVDTAELVPIGLPHDGETFNDPTAQDAADRLMMLREVGYNVPQYAIDTLVSEGLDSSA